MATGDLTTIANVKSWAGIGAGGSAADTVLTRLVTSASAWISKYTGRYNLGQVATYSEIRNGNGKHEMSLGEANVQSIVSLQIDSTIIPAQAVSGWTGYLSAGTLTVVTPPSVGALQIGATISGTGVNAGTIITAGSGLSWTVTGAQTLGSSGSPVSMSATAPLTQGYFLVPSSDVLGPNVLALYGYEFWRRERGRNVFVSYTAGWSTVPLEIEQACIELVSSQFKRGSRDPLQGSTTAAGQQTESFRPDLVPAGIKQILDSYRKTFQPL